MPGHRRIPVRRSLLASVAGSPWLSAVDRPSAHQSGAQAATTSLCQEQTASVSGGTYIVQNNEFDSSASECVTTDGNADFTVANSSIANATNGEPGAYPSIYQGCHWGNCSSGGLTSSPIEVSSLTTGKVTTSWSTTQPGGSSDYDVAYDIWFNQTPTTSGQPNGTEIMVWLNHNGSVQPFGSEVASNVSLGGHTYNVWYGAQSSWDTVTYDMTSGSTSVSNLDVGTLAQDSVSRGYISELLVPDRRRGRVRAVAGRGRAGDQLLLGQHQRQLAPTPTDADPDTDPRPRRRHPARRRRQLGYVLGHVLAWSTAGRAASKGRSSSRTPAPAR